MLGLLFVLSSAKGAVISGGGFEGQAGPLMSVVLVRGAPSTLSAASLEAPSLIAARNLQTTAQDRLFASENRADKFAAMFEGLKQPMRAADTPSRARRDAPPSKEPEGQSATAGNEHTTGPTADGRSTGALWGKIEPCWHGGAGPSNVRVILDVLFDATGAIAKPPHIERGDDDRLDEVRLNAEARAIAALRNCLPRGDARFAGKLIRLDLRPEI